MVIGCCGYRGVVGGFNTWVVLMKSIVSACISFYRCNSKSIKRLPKVGRKSVEPNHGDEAVRGKHKGASRGNDSTYSRYRVNKRSHIFSLNRVRLSQIISSHHSP